MNEAFPHLVDADRMHDDDPAPAKAEANLLVHRGAGRSCAAALAGSFAALMLGCSATGGGGDTGGGIGAITGARTSQNIVARDQAIQAQRQQAIAEARLARREAAIEAAQQRQRAADQLFLQQTKKDAEVKQQQQQQQQQGNQGKMLGRGQGNQGNIPPGQAKK